MTQATIDVLLGAVVGTIVFCCWWLLHRLGNAAHRRLRWLRWGDRALVLAHRVMVAHAELLASEVDLASHIEDAPSHELRAFAVRVRDVAAAVPPLLLSQLQRFGLTEPPPAEPPVVAPEPGPEPEHVAVVVDDDGWGDEEVAE